MVIAVTRTAFQKNAFQFNAFQIGQAQYRLLLPHTLPGGTFYDQGSIVTEGFEIPINWVPSLSVDPLTPDALTAFYKAGPRGLGYESTNLFSAENYFPPPAIQPVTYWVRSSPGFYSLTGLGVALAPVPGP